LGNHRRYKLRAGKPIFDSDDNETIEARFYEQRAACFTPGYDLISRAIRSLIYSSESRLCDQKQAPGSGGSFESSRRFRGGARYGKMYTPTSAIRSAIRRPAQIAAWISPDTEASIQHQGATPAQLQGEQTSANDVRYVTPQAIEARAASSPQARHTLPTAIQTSSQIAAIPPDAPVAGGFQDPDLTPIPVYTPVASDPALRAAASTLRDPAWASPPDPASGSSGSQATGQGSNGSHWVSTDFTSSERKRKPTNERRRSSANKGQYSWRSFDWVCIL